MIIGFDTDKKYSDKEIHIKFDMSYSGKFKIPDYHLTSEQILKFPNTSAIIIPDNINYDGFSGLSNEVKAKFKEIKPKTMGQALRIDGITPAAVYILLSHVKRKSIKHIA